MTSTEVPTPEAHPHHEYSIIVDGQKKKVTSDVESYDQVVQLAYPGEVHYQPLHLHHHVPARCRGEALRHAPSGQNGAGEEGGHRLQCHPYY